MISDKAVAKYRANYCEATGLQGQELARSFEHALVIPACGEGESLDAALASVPAGEASTLVVVVVNHREDADPNIVALNAATLERLRLAYPGGAAPFGELVVLDEVLPVDQGVGLARKLGCDFVLGAWWSGKLNTSWIHMTDADALLAADYFDAAREVEGAALVYPFEHIPQAFGRADLSRLEGVEPNRANNGSRNEPVDLDEDIARYEVMLRHYVAGLRFAGSAYAFHSIGSTIAVDALAYVRVRGVPRLLAAEDFYLLNKLAKVGAVQQAKAAPICLSSRLSDRVPFGTGRALREMETGRDRPCYHPETFALLGELLRLVDERPARLVPQDLRLRHAVEAIGLARAYEQANTTESPTARFRSRVREWLDSFRTRKLIHALRDEGLDCADAETHVPASAFVPGVSPGDGLSKILGALRLADVAETGVRRGRGGDGWS